MKQENKKGQQQKKATKVCGFPSVGYRVLSKKITLLDDDHSYSLTIKFDLFDQTGKQNVFNDEAAAEANRMKF